jgi:very-short-patch-repair endonuclease
MSGLGIRVLRTTNDEVLKDITSVLKKIIKLANS